MFNSLIGEDMESSQFKFGISVGVSLIVMGAIVATKAAIGIPLTVLGVAIIAISVFTRNAQGSGSAKPALIRTRVSDYQKSADS